MNALLMVLLVDSSREMYVAIRIASDVNDHGFGSSSIANNDEGTRKGQL